MGTAFAGGEHHEDNGTTGFEDDVLAGHDKLLGTVEI